jgi:Uri superfamily endonuclease
MNKGSYVLVIRMDEDKDITIGKKGPAHFPGGFYCYVGSAMNNLEKRICRHMSDRKKNHWHIDWLLDHARITDVKSVESDRKIECDLNRDVAGIADDTPVKGFGSSDCRDCKAHLHFFGKDPSKDLDKVIEKWKS